MLPVEFFRQPWLGGLGEGERAGTDNQVEVGVWMLGCALPLEPRGHPGEPWRKGRRVLASRSAPRALLAVAECPVCPQPSGAAAQLTSQFRAALISRLLSSRSSSSLLDKMS